MFRATGARALVVFVATLGALGAVAVAGAGTATGTQNPDLTVTLSGPDAARVGDVVTFNESTTNNTAVEQAVTLTTTVTYPSGKTLTKTETVRLAPGETLNETYTYTATPSQAKGTYTVTFAASNSNGTSSAATRITITRK